MSSLRLAETDRRLLELKVIEVLRKGSAAFVYRSDHRNGLPAPIAGHQCRIPLVASILMDEVRQARLLVTTREDYSASTTVRSIHVNGEMPFQLPFGALSRGSRKYLPGR